MREGLLTDQDHWEMDSFLAYVLDQYMTGLMSRWGAVEAIAHVIACIDNDDHDTARRWFKDHKKLLNQDDAQIPIWSR